MRSRYIHYVASFKVDGHDASRVSGVVDVPKGHNPEEVHDHIQIKACQKFGLCDEDYREDIVVEKMHVIE